MRAIARLLLAAALPSLALASPLSAQEEESFGELTRELGQRLGQLSKQLGDRQKELARRLQILDDLTAAGVTLSGSAPRTGRDTGLDAIETARAEAEREPPIEGALLPALDRAELQLRREVVGEPSAATAARFAGELAPIAIELNLLLRRFLDDATRLRTIVDGFDQLGAREMRDAGLGLGKLYEIEGRTLALQEKMLP